MGSRPSAHSLGSVLRLCVCLSGACLVSCWASTAAHRASRCFGSMQSRQPSTSLSCPSPGHPSFCHRITRLGFPSGPDEVETPDSPSLQTPTLGRGPPRPPPAQRRNAHRPLHQCMINLPISSLRFHPPSPSPRTAGSGPGPGPGPLLSSSLHSLASPRIRRVEILSHSTTPRGHPSTTRRALSSRFISRSSLGTGRHIVSEPASCITHCPLFHHPPSSLPYRNPPFSGRGYGEKVDADRHQTPDTRYRGHTHPASRGRS